MYEKIAKIFIWFSAVHCSDQSCTNVKFSFSEKATNICGLLRKLELYLPTHFQIPQPETQS